MNEALWAVAGSLVTAAILAVCKLVYDKWNDRVRLVADLRLSSGVDIHESIGCDCLILTVKNKGSRAAKISGAVLGIEGTDLIPQFEKAFGKSFGRVPVDAGPPPGATLELIPLKKPNCSDGFILERDDVVKFAIPALAPGLILIPKTQSQNVWIAVTYFDNAHEELIRGLQIQDMVGNVIEACVGTHQELKVGMMMNLHTSSGVPWFNPEVMGQTNPNPIIYSPEDDTEENTTRLQAKTRSASFRFPLYALLSADNQHLLFVSTTQGIVIPILSTKEIAEEHGSQFSPTPLIYEVNTLADLRSLIEVIQTPAGTSRKKFVLYDSIVPDNRQMAVIPAENFLAARPIDS